jgi:hypothetical protein
MVFEKCQDEKILWVVYVVAGIFLRQIGYHPHGSRNPNNFPHNMFVGDLEDNQYLFEPAVYPRKKWDAHRPFGIKDFFCVDSKRQKIDPA